MASRTTDTPRGFTPVRKEGGVSNGQVNRYLSTGTAIFVGDMVKLNGAAGAAGLKVTGVDAEGLPYVIPAASSGTSTERLVGVCVGFEPAPDQLGQNYADATNRRIVLVADDPNQHFLVQEDGDSASLTEANISDGVGMVLTAGSTVTGRSQMELDSSQASTVTTYPLRIVRKWEAPNNDMPTATSAGKHTLWVVRISHHQYNSSDAAWPN